MALAAALMIPVLIATPAQAADSGSVKKNSSAPAGSGTLSVVDEATAKALLPKLLKNSDGVGILDLCAQASYVQVFDKATGQRLITVAPGNTINVHAFTVLRHQGVVYPGSRAIWSYRWNDNTAGFDYYTTFAEGNCVMREEPNTLSGQSFPVGIPVLASVCFIPWELNPIQVVCGPVGFVNRFF
jgi:hypothetical protein